MDPAKLDYLKDKALEIRKMTIEEIGTLGVGHIGGAMSVVEILTLLYFDRMKVDPKNPRMEDRDQLVLSKGHAGPTLYATLALKGFFPMDWLSTLNQGGTHLPSHCDRNQTPGIDMTTGSLGQGFSAAVGIALGLRMDKKPSRVYTIIGDGESDEGQIWEAALFAAHQGLSNLVAFTDYNKQQAGRLYQGYRESGRPAGEMEGLRLVRPTGGWPRYSRPGFGHSESPGPGGKAIHDHYGHHQREGLFLR